MHCRETGALKSLNLEYWISKFSLVEQLAAVEWKDQEAQVVPGVMLI